MNDHRTTISMKYSTGYTSKDEIRVFLSLKKSVSVLIGIKESQRWLMIASDWVLMITRVTGLITKIRIHWSIVYIWTQDYLFNNTNPYRIPNGLNQATLHSTTSYHFSVNYDTLSQPSKTCYNWIFLIMIQLNYLTIVETNHFMISWERQDDMRNEFLISQILVLLLDYLWNKPVQYYQINDCHEEDEHSHSHELAHLFDHLHDQ